MRSVGRASSDELRAQAAIKAQDELAEAGIDLALSAQLGRSHLAEALTVAPPPRGTNGGTARCGAARPTCCFADVSPSP